MNRTEIDVSHVPPLGHDEAMRLAAVGYDRLLELLRTLDDGDWDRPTDCELWTVADIVRHLLGAAEGFASLREFLRQSVTTARDAKAKGIAPVDAMSAMQVREHADVGPREFVARLEEVAPRAVRGRRRTPALLRRMPMQLPEVGRETLGYLIGPVLVRDVFLHRVDIARATGRDLHLTPGHEGRIVADVVGDWGRRHGRPFRLVLGGPAGGSYVQHPERDPEEHRLDAVEFCRILSGRAPGEGVLSIPHIF